MDIELKNRTSEHVVVFWNKMQDDKIKRLFPTSIGTVEESLVLFENSLKADSKSFGKVIYFGEKYIGDVWCYGIDENDEKMAMLSIVIFDKAHWGKGIATVAVTTFVHEVFGKYKIEKLGAFTFSNNYASICLLRKTGFMEVEKFLEDEIESKYFEIRVVEGKFFGEMEELL